MLSNSPVEPLAGSSVHELPEPVMQLDIACVSGQRLLIYGWILGLTAEIAEARVATTDWELDLLTHAVRTARPDVSTHFGRDHSDGEDGFFALVELPAAEIPVELHCRVVAHNGRVLDRTFALNRSDAGAAVGLLTPHLQTLDSLLTALPEAESERLIAFLAPALPIKKPLLQIEELGPPVRFAVDLCCVLEERLLIVVGWILDPFGELSDLKVEFESSCFDLLECAVSVLRPDLAGSFSQFPRSDGAPERGFFFAAPVSTDTAKSVVNLSMRRGSRLVTMQRPCTGLADHARRDFLTLLNAVDPDAVITITDHVSRLLPDVLAERGWHALLQGHASHAAKRLPLSLQGSDYGYALYVDVAQPAGSQGIFLSGWYAAPDPANGPLALLLHSDADVTYDLGANLSRFPRPDVLPHLAAAGIDASGQEHGYFAFVPMDTTAGPKYLSLQLPNGWVRRMRLPISRPMPALQTIRTILGAFNNHRPQLLDVLERHIGPAVSAAWSTRHRPELRPRVEHYGMPPAHPRLSVIVPLYGRHDFAEYQLAVFADDPDFAWIELIYVVDDPSLYAEFSNRCEGLFRMYGIPFTVVFPGVNLGFAGANNCGVTFARGAHLVLMNSDVLPRAAGWASAMLRTYEDTASVGILGVKLLCENGSVQHAGMEFRRSPLWGNMWINYHLYKGQSALGLHGVREVEAVTAACVLMEAHLYRSLGGFSEDYIVGDFEDSDLCLRVAANGRRNVVALDIELYHLERQSQNRIGSGLFRSNLSIYNCWRHHRRWSTTIDGMKA